MENIFELIVPSYFEVGGYEIIILQTPEGDLLNININRHEYE